MKHGHDHAVAAAVTYDALRTALVRPDTLADETLRALIARATEAATKYPDQEGLAIERCNHVLRAYASYLRAVLTERSQVSS